MRQFFEKETRKRSNDSNYNPLNSVEEVFKFMYQHYKDKIFLKNPTFENHNLYKTYLKFNENSLKPEEPYNNSDPDFININENQVESKKQNTIKCNVIDEIFSKYLVEVNRDCNEAYFEFVTKFVILFRECINKIKSENSLEEYSTQNNADTVPDTCNEFVTDFMEGYDYFGLDTMELIEIIQHLCNWLYENKFTTSKLSLVS